MQLWGLVYPHGGGRAIAVPIAAAAIMVMWHLPIEPVRATVAGLWVWHDGGPFFGTPLANIAGWLLCAWTFFMAFALMNRSPPAGGIPAIVERRFYWLLPVGMYASFTLEHLGALRRDSIAIMTRDGHVWWTGDIYGSMALIALFTIMPISLNAAYRIFRDIPPTETPDGDSAR